MEITSIERWRRYRKDAMKKEHKDVNIGFYCCQAAAELKQLPAVCAVHKEEIMDWYRNDPCAAVQTLIVAHGLESELNAGEMQHDPQGRTG